VITEEVRSIMEDKPRLRVLIAEDNEDSAAAMTVLLQLYGYGVEVAADGLSALQAVQANPPAVLLLDIGLPKMDGWQVARHIKEQCDGKAPFTQEASSSQPSIL
jgi:CheY-like chemotaxis protein